MADSSKQEASWGPQNTGNPVLDSVVNILCSRPIGLTGDTIKALHASILGIAEQEPGGLKVNPGLLALKDD
jgi:hypothetical protein